MKTSTVSAAVTESTDMDAAYQRELEQTLRDSPAQDPSVFFPATSRDSAHLIAIPEDDQSSFLAHELLPQRITQIQPHLWLAGRMFAPRPLHIQVLMGREIVIAEAIDLHLVWTKGKIFLKPLPRYLWDRTFRDKHFGFADDRPVARAARGLLHSYTALVAYESDFRIAVEKGLLPREVSWGEWHAFVRTFVNRARGRGVGVGEGRNVYAAIDERYLYGELRLGRLNKVYRLTLRDLLYGFSRETATSLYSDYFANNFATVVAILSYVVIVLTAMQVGLAESHLVDNSAFNWACHVFTVFSLLAPLVAAGLIFIVFLYMLASHWLRTKGDQLRRYRAMDIPVHQHPTYGYEKA